jgi:hypothetical protein
VSLEEGDEAAAEAAAEAAEAAEAAAAAVEAAEAAAAQGRPFRMDDALLLSAARGAVFPVSPVRAERDGAVADAPRRNLVVTPAPPSQPSSAADAGHRAILASEPAEEDLALSFASLRDSLRGIVEPPKPTLSTFNPKNPSLASPPPKVGLDNLAASFAARAAAATREATPSSAGGSAPAWMRARAP